MSHISLITGKSVIIFIAEFTYSGELPTPPVLGRKSIVLCEMFQEVERNIGSALNCQ